MTNRAIAKLRDILAARPAARQVGELMLGTLIGQAILVVSAPILTRLYTPADYGVLGTYSALVVVLSVVATLRYEPAILLPQADEEADSLAAMVLHLTVILSLLIGIAIWVIGSWLNPAWLQPIRPYIGLLVLGVLFCAVAQVLTYRLIRLQRFRPQMHSRWTQSLFYVLTQLSGGVLRVGAVGLLVGQVVGQLVSVLLLGVAGRFRGYGYRRLWALAVRYRQFPLYSLPAALISTLGMQLPILLAAGLYSVKEAGWLLLGLRLIGMPVDLLASSLGQVYLGRAAELARHSPEALRVFVRRTLKQLMGLALVPTVLLMSAAPPLFAWLFGADWRTSGEYLQILAPVLLARLVAAPIAQTLLITRRLSLQLGWESLRLIGVALSFWLPATLHQPFRTALWIYSGVYMLSLFLLIGLILRSVHRLSPEMGNGKISVHHEADYAGECVAR
jgi:O-antigen/teichoic acid export membrane protein